LSKIAGIRFIPPAQRDRRDRQPPHSPLADPRHRPSLDPLDTTERLIATTPPLRPALHDLIKEIDLASLADLLGYSTKVMNIHAARDAIPMATYPAIRAPRPLRLTGTESLPCTLPPVLK
jgi:hypothetical protein